MEQHIDPEDMLEILDTRETPPVGWKYVYPKTNFEIVAGNPLDLLRKTQKHILANNSKIPEDLEMQISNYICRQMHQRFPSVFHRFCEIAVDPRKGKSIRGLGDVVAKITHNPVVKPLTTLVKKVIHTTSPSQRVKPCGCGGRQKSLNKKFPIGSKQK